jgi:hypothetical protein
MAHDALIAIIMPPSNYLSCGDPPQSKIHLCQKDPMNLQ